MNAVTLLNVVFAVAMAGGTIGAADTYSITLDKPAVFGKTELKAGEYRLEVTENKATIRGKKGVTAEADIVVDQAKDKALRTTMCCLGSDGKKYELREIRPAGTTMKIVVKQ